MRAMETYLALVEQGRALSMKQFSELSDDIFGEHIAQATLADWSKNDSWASRVHIDSFDASEELKRTRALLDMARDCIVTEFKDEESSGHVAASASAYRKLVGKVPKTLIPSMAEEITEFRDELYKHIMTQKARNASMTSIGTMSAVWVDMDRYLLPDLSDVTAEETVSADQIILRQRRRDGEATDNG